MSVPIKPRSDYIVAEEEPAQTKTASGLYLPEGAQEKPKTAKVLEVGANVKDIKKGDKILYKGYSTTDIKLNGTDYIIVKEEDVIATVA